MKTICAHDFGRAGGGPAVLRFRGVTVLVFSLDDGARTRYKTVPHQR
jgi:hypothetical protein